MNDLFKSNRLMGRNLYAASFLTVRNKNKPCLKKSELQLHSHLRNDKSAWPGVMGVRLATVEQARSLANQE